MNVCFITYSLLITHTVSSSAHRVKFFKGLSVRHENKLSRQRRPPPNAIVVSNIDASASLSFPTGLYVSAPVVRSRAPPARIRRRQMGISRGRDERRAASSTKHRPVRSWAATVLFCISASPLGARAQCTSECSTEGACLTSVYNNNGGSSWTRINHTSWQGKKTLVPALPGARTFSHARTHA